MDLRTITLLITLIVVLSLSSASASENDSRGGRSIILSWSPPVVDYVYVDDAVNKTVTYSITTSGQAENNWTLDGAPVNGIIIGNTISYVHTWNKKDAGFHNLIYEGGKNHTQATFRWYVNVYETEQYRGGNLFDVINDVLENHSIDIKIRMLKYTIDKHGSGSNLTATQIKKLHDEISGQKSFGSKYKIKLAKEVAKIARDDIKDEGLADEFNKLSETEGGWGEEGSGTKVGNGNDTGSDNINRGNSKNADSGSNEVVGKDGSGIPASGGGSGSSGSSGNSDNPGGSEGTSNNGDKGSQRGNGSSGNNGNSGKGKK